MYKYNFQHLILSIIYDSPFVNVLFDDLARCRHGFVTVRHFVRGELELVKVCCCTSCNQVWVKISYRDGRKDSKGGREEGEGGRDGGREKGDKGRGMT